MKLAKGLLVLSELRTPVELQALWKVLDQRTAPLKGAGNTECARNSCLVLAKIDIISLFQVPVFLDLLCPIHSSSPPGDEAFVCTPPGSCLLENGGLA